MRGGEFYMPNGSQVLVSGTTVNGYYRTRESRSILLHRKSPGNITGHFRCNIPQADGPPDAADLYINIGEYAACIHVTMQVVDILNLQLTYSSPSLLLVITLLVSATI